MLMSNYRCSCMMPKGIEELKEPRGTDWRGVVGTLEATGPDAGNSQEEEVSDVSKHS
jgi:hypothetical protein